MLATIPNLTKVNVGLLARFYFFENFRNLHKGINQKRSISHSLDLFRSIRKMSSQSFKYPKVDKDDSVVDTIFGVKVLDPYRALEVPDSESTKKFVKEQNDVTEPFLNTCPHRNDIRESLKAGQDYERIGCPFKRGSKYYLFKNSGLQSQAVLYQQDTIDGEMKEFFDPNKLSDDGTVALSITSFSPSGEYMAYGLSYSGSDWIEIKIRDIKTGKDLEDKLTKAKFTSIEWTKDNKGFFYAQYPQHRGDTSGTEVESNKNQTLFYHLLNTPQSSDILKVNFPENPEWSMSCNVSDDGNYLFVFPRAGCTEHDWYYCDLRKNNLHDKLGMIPIYNKMDAVFDYISNNGEIVYFRTNVDGATNFKIAKLELNKPAEESWIDVIKNHPSDLIESAEMYSVDGKDYLLLTFMRKVVYYLELHELEGNVIKRFDLPPGTIGKYSGERDDKEFFFQFTSFLTPGQTYYFDMTDLDGEMRMLRQTKPNNFRAVDYKINQVFFKSKDGTEVPMFLIHRSDLVKDSSNPCLLYGYGGFNIPITSNFNINRISWLRDFKGILAIANIRGGGEFGKIWHDSGRLLYKQNVFDDFIAAAEYLISEKYTRTDKLSIEGGSNGGLLVAAVSNQRPDLFGATICHVGVLDMIRFAEFTIGHAWISDYGDPKEKEHFLNLIKYSPYHNIPVETDRYPATLLLTSDHDDRVVPAHSLKFMAKLQETLGEKLCHTPLMIRIETKGGHGAGRPIWKTIDEYADIYAFLYNTLNLDGYYSCKN